MTSTGEIARPDRGAKAVLWRLRALLAEMQTTLQVMLALGGLALVALDIGHVLDTRFLTDARAYWMSGQPGRELYSIAPGLYDAFLYSPAFAQLVKPLTLLPWPMFSTLWLLLEAAAFLWLLRPLGWRWAVPLSLWCAPELLVGNIMAFVAVVLVLSVARPWAWAAIVLTKPPLGVGALWYVARREWSRFGLAVAGTLIVVAVSAVFTPELWVDWLRFMLAHRGEGAFASTFVPRLLAAAALTVYSGRRGRSWLLPFALLLATPMFSGPASLSIVAAVPRLLRKDRESAVAVAG